MVAYIPYYDNPVKIINNKLYIDGVLVHYPKKKNHGINITQRNDRLFVNGFEYKNGKWKRTLYAFLVQFL